MTGDQKRLNQMVLLRVREIRSPRVWAATLWNGVGNVSRSNDAIWGEVTSGCIAWLCWERRDWWHARSQRKIQMIYWSMRIHPKVAEELDIKSCRLTLKHLLFYSCYSVICIAKQQVTMIQLRRLPCPDFLIWYWIAFCSDYDITFLLPISPTSDPTDCTRTNPLYHWCYWVCLLCSTGGKYCTEPCSVLIGYIWNPIAVEAIFATMSSISSYSLPDSSSTSYIPDRHIEIEKYGSNGTSRTN